MSNARALRTSRSAGRNTASAASGPPSHRMYCGLSTLLVIVMTAAVAISNQPTTSIDASGNRTARSQSTARTTMPTTVATVLAVMSARTPGPVISYAL